MTDIDRRSDVDAREAAGMPPEDGSGDGWFDSPELDGIPLGYDPDYERLE